ncbi:hypothetical protein BGX27_010489 [Mortierella sp. AM989]|nr:hypothetical protein BGX27_010489 [Mortierella sp. AM989]
MILGYTMKGDKATEYIQQEGRKATVIGFFKTCKFKSYQEGSATSEWLAAIHGKPKFITQYHSSKRGRVEFWSNLKMMEHRGGFIQPIEKDIRDLTPTRRGLYNLAMDSLIIFQHDQENKSIGKDAFVALSCTLDMAGPPLQDYFGEGLLGQARASCSIPKLPSDHLTSILEPFCAIFKKDLDIRRLRKEIPK